ncbi:MAG: 6-bladed beta-propeller [Acidobacteriota bacterium]
MFTKKIWTLINCLIFGTIIFEGVVALNKPFFVQEERERKWKQLQISFPVPEGASYLQYEFSFPKKELEKEDIFFHYPFFLSSDNEDNIYVSDWRRNFILKFSYHGEFLKIIGRRGQGPGEFLNPLNICFDTKNNLIVYDSNNGRIQIFSPEGEYINSFKVFKTLSSIAASGQYLIYTSPKSVQGPLIEIYNAEGKMVDFFGERINFKYNTVSHNEVHLSINNEEELFVAWKYFPFVRRYAKEGKLLSEYSIKHKLMQERAKHNYKARMIDGRLELNEIIKAIRAKEDGFYLFSYYPRIEILEYNSKGEIKNIYWTNSPSFDYIGGDFIVMEKAKEKAFYVLQIYPDPKIDVFFAK